MKRISFTWSLLSLVALVVAGCAVREPDTLTDAVRLSALSVDQWVALGEPGDAHKVLQTFVGEWDVAISSRSSVTAKPEVSSGRSHFSWVLQGRFIEERFSGEVAGKGYDGLGYFGFDNATKRYSSLWLESLSTSPTLSWGVYNPENQSFSFVADVYDPLRARLKRSYSRIVVTSQDSFSLSMMERSSEGEEFVAFELQYKRR
jgi:hypothetical protein